MTILSEPWTNDDKLSKEQVETLRDHIKDHLDESWYPEIDKLCDIVLTTLEF